MNDLRAIGIALYGEFCWRVELAQALGVGERPLRRWAAGEDMPRGVIADLRKLCIDRAAALAEIAARMEP